MNRILAAYKQKGGHPIQYKIGPDPSSIDSCMIGGILNNNSSGMCCGVSQNTYNTLKDIRLVLADGTVLDTGDEASRAAFLEVGTFGDIGVQGGHQVSGRPQGWDSVCLCIRTTGLLMASGRAKGRMDGLFAWPSTLRSLGLRLPLHIHTCPVARRPGQGAPGAGEEGAV